MKWLRPNDIKPGDKICLPKDPEAETVVEVANGRVTLRDSKGTEWSMPDIDFIREGWINCQY